MVKSTPDTVLEQGEQQEDHEAKWGAKGAAEGRERGGSGGKG